MINADLDNAEFWAKAPAYGSVPFWRLVLSQKEGLRDDAGRELVVIGFGAAGRILCTREYAQHRSDVARREIRFPRLARRAAMKTARPVPFGPVGNLADWGQ